MSDLRNWVVLYCQEEGKQNPSSAPKRMAEIGPDVVVVECSSGNNTLMLFDPTSWDTISSAPSENVRTLTGSVNIFRINGTFEDTFAFARQSIRPKERLGWYESPQFFHP